MKELSREKTIEDKRIRGPKKTGDLILQRFSYGKAKTIGIHIGGKVMIVFSSSGRIRNVTLGINYEWTNIFRHGHEGHI